MGVSQIVRMPVQSSLIASIGYSAHAILELEFRSGALYRYFAVPPSIVEKLLAADSKGAYFNRKIRTRFPYQRLA
jgi:KTSC domain-containing protein